MRRTSQLSTDRTDEILGFCWGLAETRGLPVHRNRPIVMVSATLILWGIAIILQADGLPGKKLLLLPPVNFTIKVTGLAQVLLHWEPNPDQEPRDADLEYHVKINAPQEDDYETGATESQCVSPLHEGFSASVQTVPRSGHPLLASPWVSAELQAPPGSPGTSIVNLTCTTNTVAGNGTHLRPYRVSLHCTWVAGNNAPEDTQYFLYYRYGSWTEECQEYSRDSMNRNVACRCPRTFINSKGHDRLAVRVNGSSKHATIKPFDELFDVRAIDQTNPPINVTAEIQGTRLLVQWEKPVSAFPTHCFDYEVKIYNTKKGYVQVEKLRTNSFVWVTDESSKYSVQVRAALSSACRSTRLWSDWTPPLEVGHEEQKPWIEWFRILLLGTICFAVLIVSLLCRICHLWAKLFPPVPAPKSTIGELLVATDCQKAVSSETETEVISYVEEPGFEILENSVC